MWALSPLFDESVALSGSEEKYKKEKDKCLEGEEGGLNWAKGTREMQEEMLDQKMLEDKYAKWGKVERAAINFVVEKSWEQYMGGTRKLLQ